MVFCPHACLTPTPNLWRTGSPSRGAFASVGASELAPSPRRKRTKRLDGSLAPKASRAHFSRGGTMTSLGRVAALCVALCLCWSATIQAFYLPGVAPQDYERDDLVNIKVNKLSSVKTQLPYEYYHLPFCKPDKIVNSAENLGEVLRGDRIENSMYQIEMRMDEHCKFLCSVAIETKKTAQKFEKYIKNGYRVNMILDNLPVAMVRYKTDNTRTVKTYERGNPIGFVDKFVEGKKKDEVGGKSKGKSSVFINNHLRFTILYHRDAETDLSRIVGFEVEPFSVDHNYDDPLDPMHPKLNTCNPSEGTYVTHDMEPMRVFRGANVVFTYDVIFKPSTIKWASRWDTYLLMMDD
ncbi:endomembrane protein [Chloropicon roscoffensis]|uniref:Transmembrane 9 superfamily member n=1 Tax=Chloropicon roscoffensis TaxID=1461544 RepID=A0AAX4P7T3_9CHLO